MQVATTTAAAPPPEGDDWKWQALARRDPEADGAFVFAVRTTGVYCRPSCPSRRARPENVLFFDLNREAEAAGFRPCRRCRPNELSTAQSRTALVERACRSIEEAETLPALETLAREAGLSTWHFHRLFKQVTGVTPRAYAARLRERRAAGALRAAAPGRVTHAIFEAGWDSTGRFYENATERLGMPPGTFRKGGEGLAIRSAVVSSSLGPVLVAATPHGICAVRFGDSEAALEAELRELFPKARHLAGDDALARLAERVLARIEQPRLATELPFDIQGTAFEQQVWAALREIPTGETRSYGEIAASIGRPEAARAVARACAGNPVAVITPCHRVVRADGGLSGYRWGPERKAELLKREGARK